MSSVMRWRTRLLVKATAIQCTDRREKATQGTAADFKLVSSRACITRVEPHEPPEKTPAALQGKSQEGQRQIGAEEEGQVHQQGRPGKARGRSRPGPKPFPGKLTQQPLNATCRRSPAKKNGRSRTPTLLPINAATSHTQPCRLPEAMPLKYAPMLQPYARREP